jgi:phosphoesterase RecJ-like protein
LKQPYLTIPEQLKEILAKPCPITIVTHYNPDGDALGSSLGLLNALEQKGHTVSVVVPNQVPPFLTWMKGMDKVWNFATHTSEARDALLAADLVFCLDFNALKRIDEVEPCFLQVKKTVMIDHHPFPSNFADFNFSCPDKSSTCELVYEFLCNLGWQDVVNKNVAECLLTGIITDTGNFAHNSSNPRTFEVVAHLLETDIDKDYIHSKVFDNYSFNRMKLMGYCLNEKMVYLPKYHTAYLTITKEEQDKFQFEPGDSEGFVNIPFTIRDVFVTALFTEKKDHIRISFRSKGNFGVNKLAELYFNGGGHKNAAGGETKTSMEQAVKFFEEIISKYENEIENTFE